MSHTAGMLPSLQEKLNLLSALCAGFFEKLWMNLHENIMKDKSPPW